MENPEEAGTDPLEPRRGAWRGAYREAPETRLSSARAGGGALAVVASLLWLAAIARVVGGALTRTPFGADGALAAIYLVTGPGLILGELHRSRSGL